MRRDPASNVQLRDAGPFSAANCIEVSDAPTPEQRPRTPPVTVGLGSRLRFCHLRRAPHSCHSPAHSTARATLLGTFSARAVALPRRVFVGEFEDRFPSVLRELRGARQDKHETLYSGSRGSFPRVRACWKSRPGVDTGLSDEKYGTSDTNSVTRTPCLLIHEPELHLQ